MIIICHRPLFGPFLVDDFAHARVHFVDDELLFESMVIGDGVRAVGGLCRG